MAQLGTTACTNAQQWFGKEKLRAKTLARSSTRARWEGGESSAVYRTF
jgi:hypothetical protein